MVSALKTELLRAMTLVILSSLSAYKEKEYVRPGNVFQKFCFCCPVASFYFCPPFLPISDICSLSCETVSPPMRPASDSPSLSCALASPPAFTTLSFVSSSADAKPLLSDDTIWRAHQIINKIFIVLQDV